MKKLGNILLYMVLGATALAFVMGSIGALVGGEALAKELGEPGLGDVFGLAIGVTRHPELRKQGRG